MTLYFIDWHCLSLLLTMHSCECIQALHLYMYPVIISDHYWFWLQQNLNSALWQLFTENNASLYLWTPLDYSEMTVQSQICLKNVIPYGENPSCEQITLARLLSTNPPQILPQVPAVQILTIPARWVDGLVSVISPSVHGTVGRWKNFLSNSSCTLGTVCYFCSHI